MIITEGLNKTKTRYTTTRDKNIGSSIIDEEIGKLKISNDGSARKSETFIFWGKSVKFTIKFNSVYYSGDKATSMISNKQRSAYKKFKNSLKSIDEKSQKAIIKYVRDNTDSVELREKCENTKFVEEISEISLSSHDLYIGSEGTVGIEVKCNGLGSFPMRLLPNIAIKEYDENGNIY